MQILFAHRYHSPRNGPPTPEQAEIRRIAYSIKTVAGRSSAFHASVLGHVCPISFHFSAALCRDYSSSSVVDILAAGKLGHCTKRTNRLLSCGHAVQPLECSGIVRNAGSNRIARRHV